MRALLLLCLCSFASLCAAEQSAWRQYKSRGDTTVDYRHTAENLLQIRAQTTVKSGIGAMLHLLEDTDNIRRWVANSKKAELLDQPDAHTHIVHTYFAAPWPVSKRDMVTKSVWQQDRHSGVLTMTISDMGQQFAPLKGYVRMQQVQGQWTLTPLAERRLQIQYQGQADPAGKLPNFIADKVALKAMLASFELLAVVLPDYQQPYAGIREISQPAANNLQQ
jgi:hypothetical protein